MTKNKPIVNKGLWCEQCIIQDFQIAFFAAKYINIVILTLAIGIQHSYVVKNGVSHFGILVPF